MKIGYVKKWDFSKGWGFIEDSEGYDYFVNISNVSYGSIGSPGCCCVK